MCALDIFAQVSLRFYSFEQCITLRWLLYLNDKLNACLDPLTNLCSSLFFLLLFGEPVITGSAMSRCIGACLSAHAVKVLTSQVL
jgi:hypothetical protein